VTEETFDAASGQGRLTQELAKETWYYARIEGSNSYGSSRRTSFMAFKTTAGEIPDVVLISPPNLDTVASFEKLEWETTAAQGSVTYQLEVAIDDAFTNILYTSGWVSEQELLIGELNLEGKRTYYWRVKGKSEFGESEHSVTWIFTAGYPTRPHITEPAHLSEGVHAKPIIGWNVDADTDSVYVEFSENSDFSSLVHWETLKAVPSSAQISASLKGFTWYYCQIQALNEYGSSVFSGKKYFMTGEGTSTDPILSETDQLLIFPTIISTGELHIRCNFTKLADVDLRVIDQMGREVYRDIIHSGATRQPLKISIEYEALPGPGIYYLRLSNQKTHYTGTFIVN